VGALVAPLGGAIGAADADGGAVTLTARARLLVGFAVASRCAGASRQPPSRYKRAQHAKPALARRNHFASH